MARFHGARSFVWNHRSQYAPYAPVSEQSLLLPFVSGSLFALYLAEVPKQLPPGRAISATMKLRVAGPSPSKQVDAQEQEAGVETGAAVGTVREEVTEAPIANADVVFLTGEAAQDGGSRLASVVTTARSDTQGRFSAHVPPGDYLLVTREGYIYLEEGDSLRAKASAASDLELVIGYEEIS